jgi:hypothetical protein
MSYVLLRHKVRDFAKWKKVVQAAAEWRKAGGEQSFEVFRSSAAANDLTILCRWSDAVKARKFIGSTELRERMSEAGVIGKPQVEFFKSSENLSVS